MIVIKHRTCRDIILLRLDEGSLEGIELPEAYLASAEMAGQRCRGASFRGANLTGADLRGADLRETDLRGAKLRRSDLRGADLCGANLAEADLCAADLQGADLRAADLSHAGLFDANLTAARYDDDTRWPEGGAFIAHLPPQPASRWLAVGEGVRATRSRLSRWRSSVRPGLRASLGAAPPRFPLAALAATAVIAAAFGGVVGTQLAAHRLRPQVLSLGPQMVSDPPARLRAPHAEPALPVRKAAARQSKPRVASAAPARTPRHLRVRGQRPSSARRWRVRLAVARPQVRQTRLAFPPRFRHRRLAVRQYRPGLLARARRWREPRVVRYYPRNPYARWARSNERTHRAQARVVVVSVPPGQRWHGASTHLVMDRTPAGETLTVAAVPASNRRRDRKRPQGTRYAWGNPGLHYGAGYDLYGMHTSAR